MKLISSLIAAGFILLFTGAFVFAGTPTRTETFRQIADTVACQVRMEELNSHPQFQVHRQTFIGADARVLGVNLIDLAKAQNVTLPRELADADEVRIYQFPEAYVMVFSRNGCVIGGLKVPPAVVYALMQTMAAENEGTPPATEGTPDAE